MNKDTVSVSTSQGAQPPIPQSDLVSSGKCILLYASLAQKLGLNEAIVVQQLHFLSGVPGGREIGGEHWIFNTYEQWQKEHFPYWSLRTIRRVFSTLESMMIVESCQPDGRLSRKKYYRLNNGMWAKLLKGSLPIQNPDEAKLATSIRPDWPLPKQRVLNRESEEPKGTSPAADAPIPATWKPSVVDKDKQLRSLKPPKDYPSQDEFNEFLTEGELEQVINYRPDLYLELCCNKWHQWNKQANLWRPIRDWQAYVAALDEKMAQAFS